MRAPQRARRFAQTLIIDGRTDEGQRDIDMQDVHAFCHAIEMLGGEIAEVRLRFSSAMILLDGEAERHPFDATKADVSGVTDDAIVCQANGSEFSVRPQDAVDLRLEWLLPAI